MTREVVYADPDAMIAWAQARTPGGSFREDARAIGLSRDGELIAVSIFDTFGPRDCHFSIAAVPGRRWMTRDYARHVMAFPFIQCGFSRITCLVSDLNADSIRFTEHFGWTLEGRLREAGLQGEDWRIYGLLRRECAWVPQLTARQTPKVAL